jgi:hypothetical protein
MNCINWTDELADKTDDTFGLASGVNDFTPFIGSPTFEDAGGTRFNALHAADAGF